MSFNLFRSDKLVYKPVEENEEWDQTLYKLRNSQTFWNGDIALPTPGGSASAKEYRDILVKHCTLALYICLPKPNTKGGLDASNDDLNAIGVITLSKDGPENHSQHAQGSIGIEILPEFMGKGYGSEALRWIQWYAFHCARMHRLSIQCVEWNKGALRVYQRLGWKMEGVTREAVWFMGGWYGLVNLGLLEHEWRDGSKAAKTWTADDLAEMMKSA